MNILFISIRKRPAAEKNLADERGLVAVGDEGEGRDKTCAYIFICPAVGDAELGSVVGISKIFVLV